MTLITKPLGIRRRVLAALCQRNDVVPNCCDPDPSLTLTLGAKRLTCEQSLPLGLQFAPPDLALVGVLVDPWRFVWQAVRANPFTAADYVLA